MIKIWTYTWEKTERDQINRGITCLNNVQLPLIPQTSEMTTNHLCGRHGTKWLHYAHLRTCPDIKQIAELIAFYVQMSKGNQCRFMWWNASTSREDPGKPLKFHNVSQQYIVYNIILMLE